MQTPTEAVTNTSLSTSPALSKRSPTLSTSPRAPEITTQTTSAPRTFDTITPDMFDSLKPGQLITVNYTSCMGRTDTSGVQVKVGRRSHSKKWNVSTITLDPADGRKVPSHAKLKFLLRHESGRVSMTHGDMAVQLHALTIG